MKILSAHQLQFIPWLGYFSKIKTSKKYVFLDNLKYSNLSFQTRNKIRNISLDNWTWLIIPINKKSTENFFSDVLIDERNKNWKSKHLKTIHQSYSKTKYFDEIFTDIENIYKSDEMNLSKFIYKFVNYGMKTFEIDTEIFFQSTLHDQGLSRLNKKSQLLLDITKYLDCDCFLFGSNANKYFFDEEKFFFKKNNVNYLFQKYNHPEYKQIHPGDFLPNLSFIDILFNCGKINSAKYLKKSETNKNIL